MQKAKPKTFNRVGKKTNFKIMKKRLLLFIMLCMVFSVSIAQIKIIKTPTKNFPRLPSITLLNDYNALVTEYDLRSNCNFEFLDDAKPGAKIGFFAQPKGTISRTVSYPKFNNKPNKMSGCKNCYFTDIYPPIQYGLAENKGTTTNGVLDFTTNDVRFTIVIQPDKNIYSIRCMTHPEFQLGGNPLVPSKSYAKATDPNDYMQNLWCVEFNFQGRYLRLNFFNAKNLGK